MNREILDGAGERHTAIVFGQDRLADLHDGPERAHRTGGISKIELQRVEAARRHLPSRRIVGEPRGRKGHPIGRCTLRRDPLDANRGSQVEVGKRPMIDFPDARIELAV